jgi:S1-C subfamily serine protease
VTAKIEEQYVKYPYNVFVAMCLGLLLYGCAGMPAQMSLGGDLMANEQKTIAIYERTNPAVVSLSVEERMPDSIRGMPITEIPLASGTGFVWDKAGHIITTNHMVEGYQQVKVQLADQRIVDATVVGLSAEYDLAVLKLQGVSALPPPVILGSSNGLKVGQTVFTIGNAFGLGRSFTTGIVSALGRDFEGEEDGVTRNLIQTDAAINPGGSGSPLLDSHGRVIGVNVAIYSLSGGSDGVSFAIPIDDVKQVIPQLLAAKGAH